MTHLEVANFCAAMDTLIDQDGRKLITSDLFLGKTKGTDIVIVILQIPYFTFPSD